MKIKQIAHAQPSASVKSLKARGGFDVDLTPVTIRSKLGGNLRLRTYESVIVKDTSNQGKSETVLSWRRCRSQTAGQSHDLDCDTNPGTTYTLIPAS